MSTYYPKTLKKWHYQQFSRTQLQNQPHKTSFSSLNRSLIIHSLHSQSQRRYSHTAKKPKYMGTSVDYAKKHHENSYRQTKSVLKRSNKNNFKLKVIQNKFIQYNQQAKYNTHLGTLVNSLLRYMPSTKDSQFKTERLNRTIQQHRIQKYQQIQQKEFRQHQTLSKGYIPIQQKYGLRIPQSFSLIKDNFSNPNVKQQPKLKLQLDGNNKKVFPTKCNLYLKIKEMNLSHRSKQNKGYHHNTSKDFLKAYNLYKSNHEKEKIQTQPQQKLQPWQITDNHYQKEFKSIS